MPIISVAEATARHLFDYASIVKNPYLSTVLPMKKPWIELAASDLLIIYRLLVYIEATVELTDEEYHNSIKDTECDRGYHSLSIREKTGIYMLRKLVRNDLKL